MNLKKATLLAVVGLSYTFLIRTLNTFFPALFESVLLTKFNSILSLLAFLAVLLFFVYFLKEFSSRYKQALKVINVLVICALSFLLVVRLEIISNSFPAISNWLFEYFQPAYRFFAARILENYYSGIVWITSFLIILFYWYIILPKTNATSFKLRRAALFALIGSIFMALLHTWNIIFFLFLRSSHAVQNLTPGMVVILFPVFLFNFIVSIYFLLQLRSELKY